MFPGFDQVRGAGTSEVSGLRLPNRYKALGVKKPPRVSKLFGVFFQIRDLNTQVM